MIIDMIVYDNEKIKFLYLKSGLLWPYYGKKKALSANTLTKELRNEIYKQIPEYILLRAANRGKFFHKTIQNFFENKKYPEFLIPYSSISKINEDNKFKKLEEIEKRIFESISFFKKYLQNNFQNNYNNFIGSEKLCYSFYKGIFFASYIDLEFENFVIELKSNNKKNKDNITSLLLFEIQLLIQYICTKKNIFLFWATDDGIFFHKFKISKELLNVFDMLIELHLNYKNLSILEKNLIIKRIIYIYSISSIKNIKFMKYLI